MCVYVCYQQDRCLSITVLTNAWGEGGHLSVFSVCMFKSRFQHTVSKLEELKGAIFLTLQMLCVCVCVSRDRVSETRGGGGGCNCQLMGV